MARLENVFALLGDGDGDDDVSALLERVAAVKAEPPPPEKKKKDKQQQHQKQPVEKEESDWGLDDAVSMKAKPIVLPDYVTRRDIVVRKNEPEGRERRQGRGSERSEPGGKGYQRNFGGSDGYKRNNGGRNGNQRKNGGLDGYQDDNGGGSVYHGNNGGDNDFQRNDGAESGNAVGDDWQEQGRGRGGGGRGRGRGRGRGGGGGFNQSKEFGSESQLDVNNYQIEKQGHDGNDNDGWEQKEFQGKESGNETKYDVRPRNVNRGRGGDGRGYGRGNRGFGGQEGRFYDRQDGRNNRRGGDSRRGEVSNESESKENVTGDIENAVKVDDYSGGAEWDVPVTTEGTAGAVHEQEKLEAQADSEKKAKDTDENEEEKEMTLEEYEKVLLEKRKALEALRKTEGRKVTLDKDLESMQLVERKKDDSLFIKLKSEKEKLKKKGSLEKDDKVRKSMSINEFLKPAEGELHVAGRGRGGRGRGRGGRGESRGEFLGRRRQVEAGPAPSFEDPNQFPVLGGAAVAS
ncbi:hypothetical protein I3843_14G042100 [Carya illinoinensis]|nr:hypothetical protein I3843_14G042100 [Carya illinoinensis]